MKRIVLLVPSICLLTFCSQKSKHPKENFIIANGQVPNLAVDNGNTIHLVYGYGDSLMYASSDHEGTFSKPSLVAVLPKMFSFAMRGPQIAATEKGLVVTACTSVGDIFSFYKEDGKNWIQGNKVNDTDTTAKEGLTALSADGKNTFAVWLDLRDNKRNKIYGAQSRDGGKTWSKNIMVYTSPDTSVCECCKPSVAVKRNHVYVMFRNWLQGNRDLFLIQSNDGGNSFGNAQKLGNGNWKLDGCPMDGGGIAINKKGEIQTVWRREATLFAAVPGRPEKEIGEGKECTMAIIHDKNVYAWSENGEIVIMNAKGEKKILGEGSEPVLKALNNDQLICVWNNKKQIHAAIFDM